MKTLFTFILFCCVFNLKAQRLNQKIFGDKNYLEFGHTYAHYPNAGFGCSTLFLTEVSFRRTNYYLAYNRLIKNKYMLGFDFLFSNTPNNNFEFNLEDVGKIMMIGFKSYSLGFGKIYQFSKFQLIPKVALSHRYFGGQWTVFGYRNPGAALSETLFATLDYNSIGFSTGVDANYFFTKNAGIGLKTSYHLYPFENAKLSAYGIDQPDPLIVATHKPLNNILLFHLKVVGRL
jgi:hypothetical protein